MQFKKFVLGFDHNVDVKTINRLMEALSESGVQGVVFENYEKDNDYPLLAQGAYKLFLDSKADGLLLLCGTGIGMNMVANKFNGIRSVLATSEAEAYFARRHENANSIVFGIGYSDGNVELKLCKRKMIRMLKVFIETDFEGNEPGGERHVRRVNEICEIEKGGKK